MIDKVTKAFFNTKDNDSIEVLVIGRDDRDDTYLISGFPNGHKAGTAKDYMYFSQEYNDGKEDKWWVFEEDLDFDVETPEDKVVNILQQILDMYLAEHKNLSNYYHKYLPISNVDTYETSEDRVRDCYKRNTLGYLITGLHHEGPLPNFEDTKDFQIKLVAIAKDLRRYLGK